MNKLYRLWLPGDAQPCAADYIGHAQIMTDAQLWAVSGQGVLMPSYLLEPRIVGALNQLAGCLDQQGYDRAAQTLYLEANWLGHVLPPRGLIA